MLLALPVVAGLLPAAPALAAPALPGRQPSTAGAGRTLFGLSLPGKPGETTAQTVARTQQRFDSLPVVRVYANKPPARWQDDRLLDALPPGTSVIYTFEVPSMGAAAAGAYDSNVATLLKTKPAGVRAWVGLLHEPEGHVGRGEFSAATYRSATGRIAKVTKANGGIATTVLTARTAFGKKGKAYRDYYNPEIDVLAWNAYNSAQKNPGLVYKEPQQFIDPIKEIARETGTGFGWAEFGAPCIVSDRSCAQRARWLPVLGHAMSASGAEFVAYWNRKSLNGKIDYSLSDPASINAWKALMAG